MTQQQTDLILPLLKSAEMRRSVYQLNKNLPLTQQEVRDLTGHVLKHTPSAFNSQSARIALLFGQEHEALWEIVRDSLKPFTAEKHWETTSLKVDGFKAAAGTALFFEEMDTVKALQEKFPLYKESFADWSEQSSAINQYRLWQLLAAAGAGANLQHYNPLIDEAVQKRWNIPPSYRLRAQLVFGGIAAPAGEKEFLPVEDRLTIYGSQD
jgi:predicted oxidoreductase (fatty acid repression mutant protein)